MDSKEREKCRGFVTLALEPKFQHFMPSNGIECLEEAHSITMRVIALTERLTGCGCQDVFIVRTDLDTNGSIIGDGRPVNFLLDPDSVSLSMIRASNRFYRRFGRDHTSSEDLNWSGTLIFN